MVQLKLTAVHSVDLENSTFDVKPHVTKSVSVGNVFIDVDSLQKEQPHVDSIALKGNSYANVELMLGQDMFHVIWPLGDSETDRQDTPFADWLLLS